MQKFQKRKLKADQNYDAKFKTLKILTENTNKSNQGVSGPHKTVKIINSKKENIVEDSEKTDKMNTERLMHPYQIDCEHPNAFIKESPHKNILKIKNSISEILDESVKNHLEIRKLREKLESAHSYKENSENTTKKGLLECDVSSIKSSPKRNYMIAEQINELKMQLMDMNRRLLLGEQKISAKSIENYGLRYTISNLHEQLDKIKRKEEKRRVKNSMCANCYIF